jgi:hypothetical protein
MCPFRDENAKVALRANVGGKAENSGKTVKVCFPRSNKRLVRKVFIAREKDQGKSR